MIELEAALAERTSDLQRPQAEYVNYKRRVDRDRDLARKVTIEGVLKDFLSVLDDVRSGSRARGTERRLQGRGRRDRAGHLQIRPGDLREAGEPFNPHIHEALLHAHAEGIDGPTCVEILQPGYRIGDHFCGPPGSHSLSPSPMRSLSQRARGCGRGRADEPEAVEESSPGPADESVEAAGDAGRDESATTDNQA